MLEADPLNSRLEKVFNLFDSGNKGEIDVRELGTVVRALGKQWKNKFSLVNKVLLIMITI